MNMWISDVAGEKESKIAEGKSSIIVSPRKVYCSTKAETSKHFVRFLNCC